MEEPDDEMGESNAAGAAIAGTATRKGPAPAAEGEGAPLRPPIAKKRKICCSVCRKTGHQKPKCPDLEYADAETPKPTLNVVEGQVIRCWDIESDASTKVVYESGSCLTKFTNRRWHDLPGELKTVLHHTALNLVYGQLPRTRLRVCQKHHKAPSGHGRGHVIHKEQ